MNYIKSDQFIMMKKEREVGVYEPCEAKPSSSIISFPTISIVL